jgi:3-dehydroquinate dehydratase I
MNAARAFPSLNAPLVVGSVGSPAQLNRLDPHDVATRCDLMEIRLDGGGASSDSETPSPWGRFSNIPLLFTARRCEEGGLGQWTTQERMTLLIHALPSAACIDIEAASIADMDALLHSARIAGVPWIASYHDFQGLPAEQALRDALTIATQAGAAAFKWAAMVHSPGDLAWMADFQRQDHGIPVASMGMGPMAAVSRLLCAQYGSVLNYGYLGSAPTAPGQWDAGTLRESIARLPVMA